MVIIDMMDEGDPYPPKEQEIDPSVPLVTDVYEGLIGIYTALNNNTDQIGVGFALALLNLYF